MILFQRGIYGIDRRRPFLGICFRIFKALQCTSLRQLHVGMTQPGKDHGGYDRRPEGVNGTLPEALIAKPEPIILLGLQGLSHHFRAGLGRRQSRRALGEFLESHLRHVSDGGLKGLLCRCRQEFPGAHQPAPKEIGSELEAAFIESLPYG